MGVEVGNAVGVEVEIAERVEVGIAVGIDAGVFISPGVQPENTQLKSTTKTRIEMKQLFFLGFIFSLPGFK